MKGLAFDANSFEYLRLFPVEVLSWLK